jgi:hypothetical protein
MLSLTRALYHPKVPEKYLKSTKGVHMPNQKQFKFTMDENLHKAFMAVCKDLDTTAARELRAYIRKFVRQNSQTKLDI